MVGSVNMRLMTPLALILLALVGSARPLSANPLLLFDAATGEVLLSRDAGAKWHPASLTKLMTAYLTFQSLKAGQLTLDTKLTVPQEALDVSPSKIGLKPGSTITTDLALKALLVYSANDMALTLAAAQGGIPAFVQRMNDTARALNMGSTHFVNPHGLHDPEQTTSARDIGLLAFTIANRYPEYRHYFSEPYVAFGKRKLLNRNMLLRQMPTADGMKTGFVCPSGFNLVASATQNGRRLIAVVMGAMTAYSRADIAQALLEAGFVAGQRQTKQLVSQIADEPTLPPNLKPMVCGSGIPVARADQVNGWGVSLGRYKGVAKADSVLASNVALASGTLLDTMPRGVLKVPFVKNEYLAMAWGMPEQQTTETVCNRLRMLNHPCEVMSPQAVDQFQRQALQERTSRPEPTAAKPTKRKTRTAKAKANSAKASAAKANTAKANSAKANTAKISAAKAKGTASEAEKGDR
jgi:D-alanyl-D-alanine carboxypeptidase